MFLVKIVKHVESKLQDIKSNAILSVCTQGTAVVLYDISSFQTPVHPLQICKCLEPFIKYLDKPSK